MRVTAIVLLFFLGLNALVSGYLFIYEPSGAAIGLNTDYIKHSPFSNFLIPGIFLFTFIGISSCIVAILSIKKTRNYQKYIFLQGLILSSWILIQVGMVRDFNLMHFICLSSGLIQLYIGKKLN